MRDNVALTPAQQQMRQDLLLYHILAEISTHSNAEHTWNILTRYVRGEDDD